MSAALYLIRKGGAYYRPNSQGYTRVVEEAGRYTLEEAEAITHPNGPGGPRDGMDYVPAPTTEKEELLPAAQDALDRMKRAAERGTGCHLTAEMIQELNLTFLGQAWHEERNR